MLVLTLFCAGRQQRSGDCSSTQRCRCRDGAHTPERVRAHRIAPAATTCANRCRWTPAAWGRVVVAGLYCISTSHRPARIAMFCRLAWVCVSIGRSGTRREEHPCEPHCALSSVSTAFMGSEADLPAILPTNRCGGGGSFAIPSPFLEKSGGSCRRSCAMTRHVTSGVLKTKGNQLANTCRVLSSTTYYQPLMAATLMD